MAENDDEWISLQPREPLPSQCCGSGCQPCVFDIYEMELGQWKRAKANRDQHLLRKNNEIYEDGLMSRFVKTWKEGNTVCWRGPFGNCPYKPNQYEQLLLFASGTGIAPMVSLIQYIVANEEDEAFITLVGCFRTFQDIYMKPRLQELAAYWNVKMLFVLSQEQDLTHLLWSYREKTYLGRINCDMVKNFVNSCRRKPFIMVCGSITFNKDVLNYLNQLGLSEDNYFVF
ncbi:NADH-cytochrome b5 reductase-like isoform X2 [Rhinoraja longicauda]